MKVLLFFMTLTLTSSAFAIGDEFKITGIDCKTEFNTGIYRKNLFGKIKRKESGSVRVDSFGVPIQVNKDGSAFSTGSSYSDGTDRLSTLFKTKKDAQGNVHVSINFRAQGRDVVPRIEYILGPDSNETTIYEKTDIVELEEPLLWKDDGRNKIKLESVFYNCQALLELKKKK